MVPPIVGQISAALHPLPGSAQAVAERRRDGDGDERKRERQAEQEHHREPGQCGAGRRRQCEETEQVLCGACGNVEPEQEALDGSVADAFVGSCGEFNAPFDQASSGEQKNQA